MLSPLIKIGRVDLLALGLAVSIFYSCSKPHKIEPEVVETPAEYELKDVRYFMDAGDRLDTVTVKREGMKLRNSTAILSTQQFEDNFEELVKTSQFEVDKSTVPADVKLDRFEVQVPERWYGEGSYGYFSEKFPLSSAEQQKPYGVYKKDKLAINIPPNSTIVVDRQIDAYHLVCSFSGLIENKTTGQRYSLKGKWKGIVSYNNSSVSLNQYPLSE